MEQHSADQNGHGGKDQRSVKIAMLRGARLKCPSCGQGKMFFKYLKVYDSCTHCCEDLHHHQADDAPPYFTVLILGHLLVPIVIAIERIFTPPIWAYLAFGLPITIALALIVLQITKGAIIGLQWACHMHGFGGNDP